MRSLKSILTLSVALLLVLSVLSSCGGNTASGGGESGGGDETTKDPLVLKPEETEPELVPSPSLGGIDEIVEVGFSAGDVVVEAERADGVGVTLERLNQKGKPIWKAIADSGWAVQPSKAIPEGFPTMIVPIGTTVELHNHTSYEISSDLYVDFSGSKEYAPDELPEGEGIYIRVVTINIPKPTDNFESITPGEFFGECRFFLVVGFA